MRDINGRANAGTTIRQCVTLVVLITFCVKDLNIESSRIEVAHHLLTVFSMQIHTETVYLLTHPSAEYIP